MHQFAANTAASEQVVNGEFVIPKVLLKTAIKSDNKSKYGHYSVAALLCFISFFFPTAL